MQHLFIFHFMNAIMPLAERLRPQKLEDLVGQPQLTATNSVLFACIQSKKLPSLIFWGPPGVGKTTLAQIIAHQIQKPFFQLSAISSGVKDVREIIETAAKLAGAVLFIDEIHRFNKGQQDALLGAVEKGIITLIGATTENPSFEVNNALLSRCQVYTLQALSQEAMQQILLNALEKDIVLNKLSIKIAEFDAFYQLSGGDARKLLNTLELVVNTHFNDNKLIINNQIVTETVQQKLVDYDKNGDWHYDIVSAFIKSMRGSDPNGAVYWLARMIAAGESVKFIARRMLIFAAEDIGNANPNALLMANTSFDAVNKIGYPEARIILSQCAIYLACSVKSNASYMAIDDALAAVAKTGNLPVPLHLRNAPTTLMKQMDYGKNYQYSHLGENNFIEQEYLPDVLKNRCFYVTGNNEREEQIKKFLHQRWKGKYGY